VRLTRKKVVFTAAVAAAVSTLVPTRDARATGYIWDGTDSATNTNWTNPLNWTADLGSPASIADTATFDNTGIANPLNTVDTSLSIGKLTYQQDNSTADGLTNAYMTVIAPGAALSPYTPAASNLTTPGNASLLVMPATAATAQAGTGTYVKIKSGAGAGTPGELKMVSSTGNMSLAVSGRPATSGPAGNFESFAVLDLSELDKFTFSTAPSFAFSSFGIGTGLVATGDQGAVSGKLILGNVSNIDANRISIGGQSNAGTGGQQPVSLLMLGQTNNINVNLSGNTDVGGDPNATKDSSGGMVFRAGMTDPALNMGSQVARAAMGIARHRGGTGHSSFGVVDLTSASGTGEGSFNAFLTGTLRIGTGSTSGAGGGIGALSMDKGTVNTDGSLLLGATGSTTNATPNLGFLNVGVKGGANDAGAGSFTATNATTPATLTLGQRNQAGAVNQSTGVLNVANSGSVFVDRVFLANNTVADAGSGATAGQAQGIVNLNGGTLTTGQIKAGSDTAQVGTLNTRVVNFNGGTLAVKPGTTFAGNFMEGLTRAVVNAGGATIDSGNNVTINQALEAPSGNGVTGVNVVDGGSGYRVAPVVLITPATGDTGTGATAVAQINSAGKVTGVTVTNPGQGYTATPTIQLVANGGTSLANMLVPFNGTAATLSVATGALSTSGGLTKTGSGAVTLNGLNTYAGNTTVNGGSLILGKSLTKSANVAANSAILRLPSDGTFLKVIKTGAVAVIGTGQIDIDDNKLISGLTPVGTATGGVYDGVTGMIQSGRNGGTWNGSGIITSQSTAAAGNFTTLGVATAQQVKSLATASDTAVWSGQTVTGSDSLVMYTYGGDANLDGKINVDDYGHIDSSVVLPGVSGWFNGDFNYDGKINVDDYGIIDSNVPIQGAAFPTAGSVGSSGLNGVSAVPEPGSIGLLAAAGAGALSMARRRRSRSAR
jgi:autotransporter-associated beta strand protein